MYCYSEIMDKFFSKSKRKAVKISTVNSDRLARLLNLTLLINPELTSFWNKRREMVVKSFLYSASELLFTKLVLSRKPKCNEAFAHRRWILEIILKGDTLQADNIEALVNDELHICDLAAENSPNNYHSWNHRIWLLNRLQQAKQFNLNLQYIKEYEYSERWSSKHVSDYSCFHYRQYCIKNIFSISNENWATLYGSAYADLRKSFVQLLASNFPKDKTIQASQEDLVTYTEENLINLLLGCKVISCSCNVDNVLLCRKIQVLFSELVLNNELLRFYKYHETLWYHRRFIVHEIVAIMYDYFDVVRQNGVLIKNSCAICNVEELRQKQAKIVKYDSNCIYSRVLFKILLCHEKKFIQERRNDGDNYADRHEKYLKFVEGLNYVM
ncbi:protein prenyltransferase alpha subunit repeat-containing protein 1-B isoform X2 [Plodia interpunctella]|nr:protein prenyltransferase alpha subunit repeat-containing protein 1-B isoform X2 [Plodia interpunctella]